MNRDSSPTVIFSNRAYLGIIAETHEKVDTETGGILLGKYEDGLWYVLECLDPGPRSIFRAAYFEYDTPYVTHLANKTARFYKNGLDLIGLWHRHPGSFSAFSSTDDSTNSKYAAMCPAGAISALVNLDPNFRLTVFRVTLPLNYEPVGYRIGDALIPPRLTESKKVIDFISGRRQISARAATAAPARWSLIECVKGLMPSFDRSRTPVEQPPLQSSAKSAQAISRERASGLPNPVAGSADALLAMVENEIAFLESQQDLKASLQLSNDELIVHIRDGHEASVLPNELVMVFGVAEENRGYVKINGDALLYIPGFIRKYLATSPSRKQSF